MSKVTVIIVTSLLFISGCSQSNHSGGAVESQQKTIEFMHLWPSGSSTTHYRVVEEIIEAFESENPGIVINAEPIDNEQYKDRMTVLSSANNLPDVGFTWAAGYLEPFVEGGRIAPLDQLLAEDLKDAFVPGTVEAFQMEGATYGLPLELNIAPIYFNKSLFIEAGVQVPSTYEEFLGVIQVLLEHNITPITVGNRDAWTGSLWYMYLADRYGGASALTQAINRTGSFTEQSFVEAAREIQNLVDQNAFVTGFNGLSNDEAKAEFLNGNAAMYLMGSWDLPEFTTNEANSQEFRDSIDYFKFPTVAGGAGDIESWVGGPGVGLYVAENSDVKDEALAFVKFFIEKWGEKAVTEVGVIPATKVDTEVLDIHEMYIKILKDLNQASHITLFADVQMSPAVAQIHLNLIQALFGQEVTPEQFALEHEEAFE